MVAYSFKHQFIEPIRAGTKRQTIRAERKRHARPGEDLQLYSGMRTKHCVLIGRAVCRSAEPIRLTLSEPRVEFGGRSHWRSDTLNTFARSDGFADWNELVAFWAENHPGIDPFSGVLITWGGFQKRQHVEATDV